MTNLTVFLQGVCAATSAAIGLLFLRYWQETRDRLFAFFSLAFWIMALSWVLLGVISPTQEGRPYIYSLRLLTFALIIAATVDKSRRR
jgi:hypothetical protein